MRNRLMIGTAALLLASASLVVAQDKAQQTAPSNGTISVGGRVTSTSGDEARYERYQDLRNGANVNILYNKETSDWTFDVKATNIGYRDQSYVANFNSRRIKASVMFDQTPLNYMNNSPTPYSCTAGNCSLSPTLRQAVQSARGVAINKTTGAYTPNNGSTTIVGVPQTVAQLANGTIFPGTGIDIRSRRDTIAGSLIFSATDNLNLIFGFDTFKKSGNQPWGASFAFANAAEVPLVIDNRTTEWNAAVEWASHQGTMRMGYTYSKFDQKIPSFTFDNPLYATDFNVFSAPLGVSYDPSGYSASAGGAAVGRMAMAPTNTQTTFDWLGMIKLPGHTTANGTFAMAAGRQNAALIPWTTNSTITNAGVYKAFPGLASLEDSANMRVNYATGTFNVTSRPVKDFTLTARYRFNSRTDFTRSFDAVEYVRFDAVPEETGGETEPLNINRNTFDVTAAYAMPVGTLRAGYTVDRYEHTERATEGWKDNTTHVSYDLIGTQMVTVRAQYDYTKRDAIDTSTDIIAEGGAQTALRFYDEASRKRNRGSVIVDINPLAMVGLNFTYSGAKDDYQGADAGQQFGLLNNKNNTFTMGVNVAPNEKVNFGADYGRTTYKALQQSRNSNPAPDAQWTDPNRNWTLNNNETVNNASAYLNLVKIIAKTDLRAGYDYMDSDQAFIHGGPRLTTPTTGLIAVGQFVALPNVTNKWQRLSFDLTHSLNQKVGLGFSYYFEKFDVADFATLNTAGSATLPLTSLGAQTDTPRNNWLGSITTGYGNRPYKGQTAYFRVFYNF